MDTEQTTTGGKWIRHATAVPDPLRPGSWAVHFTFDHPPNRFHAFLSDPEKDNGASLLSIRDLPGDPAAIGAILAGGDAPATFTPRLPTFEELRDLMRTHFPQGTALALPTILSGEAAPDFLACLVFPMAGALVQSPTLHRS